VPPVALVSIPDFSVQKQEAKKYGGPEGMPSSTVPLNFNTYFDIFFFGLVLMCLHHRMGFNSFTKYI
jgi:hypothetical protein